MAAHAPLRRQSAPFRAHASMRSLWAQPPSGTTPRERAPRRSPRRSEVPGTGRRAQWCRRLRRSRVRAAAVGEGPGAAVADPLKDGRPPGRLSRNSVIAVTGGCALRPKNLEGATACFISTMVITGSACTSSGGPSGFSFLWSSSAGSSPSRETEDERIRNTECVVFHAGWPSLKPPEFGLDCGDRRGRGGHHRAVGRGHGSAQPTEPRFSRGNPPSSLYRRWRYTSRLSTAAKKHQIDTSALAWTR